jgi:hypothetical protein
VHHRIDLFISPTWCTLALSCNICITLAASTCFEQYYAHLQCTARLLVESDIPDAVEYNLNLLKMSIVLLETFNVIHTLQNKEIVHQFGDKNKFILWCTVRKTSNCRCHISCFGGKIRLGPNRNNFSQNTSDLTASNISWLKCLRFTLGWNFRNPPKAPEKFSNFSCY